MIQPLLLAPHEIAPPTHPQYSDEPFAFRALWDGRERDFVGQVKNLLIFFALTGEPERGNFVNASVWASRNPNRPAPPICEPRTEIPRHNLKRIVEVTADEGWGRLYFLDENLNLAPAAAAVQWRLFLAQSGWGQWCAAPRFYEGQARFRWHKDAAHARQLALLPPLQLWERVRASLLEKASDAALAREFALLGGAARHQLCRPVARGSYEQWRQVLQWYVQCCGPTAEKKRLSLVVYASLGDVRNSWSVAGKRCRLPAAVAEFCQWTHRFFAPTLDEEFLSRCSAAAAFSQRSFKISVSTDFITQHERLEALLHLRDWLRDKAAPDQINQWLAPQS